jgi:3-deoxy-D-manno-octulosonate 8-phosphate phosphatase (KDO 8-P phosphatase)
MKKNIKKIIPKIKLIVFDFDGVFTNNKVLTFQDGSEAVWCDRSDGLGITDALKKGIKMMVLSAEKNPVVSARCRKLKLTCVQDVDDKIKTLKQTALRFGIGLDEIAFVGNDNNDVECMENVGLPIAVIDAYPKAISAAKYITKKHGGNGAVREICAMFISAHSGVKYE